MVLSVVLAHQGMVLGQRVIKRLVHGLQLRLRRSEVTQGTLLFAALPLQRLLQRLRGLTPLQAGMASSNTGARSGEGVASRTTGAWSGEGRAVERQVGKGGGSLTCIPTQMPFKCVRGLGLGIRV